MYVCPVVHACYMCTLVCMCIAHFHTCAHAYQTRHDALIEAIKGRYNHIVKNLEQQLHSREKKCKSVCVFAIVKNSV